MTIIGSCPSPQSHPRFWYASLKRNANDDVDKDEQLLVSPTTRKQSLTAHMMKKFPSIMGAEMDDDDDDNNDNDDEGSVTSITSFSSNSSWGSKNMSFSSTGEGDNDDNNTYISSTSSDESSVTNYWGVSSRSLAVGELPQEEQLPSKPCVRFDLSANEEYNNTEFAKKDCRDRWYQKPDYEKFRGETRALGRLVRESEAGGSSKKNKSSNQSSSSKKPTPGSYEKLLLRLYDSCRSATSDTHSLSPADGTLCSSDDYKQLQFWAKKTPGRLGLERFAVQQLGLQESLRQNVMMETVLYMQDTGASAGDLDEMIRRSAEQISLPSRLFARTMADAQQAAADSSCTI